MRKFCKIFTCFALSALLVFGSVNASYLRAKAAATGTLVAGYTIAEILAMLGVAISGTVILTEIDNQLGGDVPEHLFNEMNLREAGIGDKLKQYCEIGSTLSPGDKLSINEGDFKALSRFFANNPVSEFTGTFGGNYDSADYERLKNQISNFCGFSVSDANGNLQHFLEYNSSSAIRCIQTNNYNSVFLCSSNCIVSLTDSNYHFENTAPWGFIFGDPFDNAVSFIGAGYVGFQQNRRAEGYTEILLNGISVTSVQDPHISLPLVNDEYDILNPGRVMDNTGAISGGISINMPLTLPLQRAIEAENVQAIYNLMNVYPVSTAADTLIYYPDISAKGYEVEEKNTPSAVDFAPLNDLITGTNSKYTMDLSTFFPFCIPFDVYDFVAVFNATPQAPVITWKFPNGDGTFTEQTLDFSIFDPVARVFRTCELIAFCVGLAMVTRSMFIRG